MSKWKYFKFKKQAIWEIKVPKGLNKYIIGDITVTHHVGNEYGIVGNLSLVKEIGITKTSYGLLKRLKRNTAIRNTKKGAIDYARRLKKEYSKIIKRK